MHPQQYELHKIYLDSKKRKQKNAHPPENITLSRLGEKKNRLGENFSFELCIRSVIQPEEGSRIKIYLRKTKQGFS